MVRAYKDHYVLTKKFKDLMQEFNNMGVKYMLLTETAKRPTKGSEQAAGWDLYADTEKPVAINPGESILFKTGVAMSIPSGYFGALYARSGIASKHGLRPANCTGIIDADYRGDISVPLYNDSGKIQTIQPHERIAQLVIQPYMTSDLEPVEKLDETERGKGGFGSTGSK